MARWMRNLSWTANCSIARASDPLLQEAPLSLRCTPLRGAGETTFSAWSSRDMTRLSTPGVAYHTWLREQNTNCCPLCLSYTRLKT
mmetsp:Transcript_84682/g.146340  ORF Transcript_84682/g.146340 Transcript_84682/m.146340 type:complete len:86 (+) Transcript_84682:575-832(+)